MVTLLYGDEPQLIEEKKLELFNSYGDMSISTYHEDIGTGLILAKLNEDSLFGEKRVFCFVNLPIFKKSSKSVSSEWNSVAEQLLAYKGENPVILIYHDTIDKRVKANLEIINRLQSFEFKKLKGPDLLNWVINYGKEIGFSLDPSARLYLEGMMELWDDVTVMFLRTEFDRLSLLLTDTKVMDETFLRIHMSDFKSKKIFAFKEALFNKDVETLRELFPFMLQPKERDRAFAFVESQLRLQLMVNECALHGMRLQEIQSFLTAKGGNYNSYAVKKAYEVYKKISLKDLATLLHDLTSIVKEQREGKGDSQRLQDICLSYCYSR